MTSKIKCSRCQRIIGKQSFTQHYQFCQRVPTPYELAKQFLDDPSTSVSAMAQGLGLHPGNNGLRNHLSWGLSQMGVEDPEEMVKRRSQENKRQPQYTKKMYGGPPPDHHRCGCGVVIPLDEFECDYCRGDDGRLARIVVGDKKVRQGGIVSMTGWLVELGYKRLKLMPS